MAKTENIFGELSGGVNPSPNLLSNTFTTVASGVYTKYLEFDLTDTGYTRLKGKMKTVTYIGAYIIDSGSYVDVSNTTTDYVDIDIAIPSGSTTISFAVKNNRNAYNARVMLKDLEWS